MNTEITDNTARNPVGWIFFDAECRFCVAGRRRWGAVFERRGYVWLPLQTAGPARLGVTQDQLMAEMWVLPTGGRPLNGVSAWVELMRRVWWLSPLAFVLALPGIKGVGQGAYRWIARNRYCIGGACRIPTRRDHLVAWLPLILLPTPMLLLRDEVPAWVFMWAMAFALYAGCKWLTYRDAIRNGESVTLLRAGGYLLIWAGMDAKAFLGAKAFVSLPRTVEWLFATAKTLFGAALVWFVVRRVSPPDDLLIGWTGMLGVIFLLHFGSFHLLSLGWRAAGVNAAPLMQNPLRAVSLAEFWGKRWNTAFHELVHRFTFRPMARRVGATGATLLVFLLSGLVHEIIISLPARGGYGLPTGYFLIQGLGVAGEHAHFGRQLGLGHGWRGWLFTMLTTVAPAFWLFHPPFIRNVILPMLRALGAT